MIHIIRDEVITLAKNIYTVIIPNATQSQLVTDYKTNNSDLINQPY